MPDAFVSYSHGSDGPVAAELERSLERFAKPWWRRRALDVFRDTTGLAVNPSLWDSITEALDGSDHLVLVVSPGAAASRWVNREVEHWLAGNGVASVVPVITGGTWTTPSGTPGDAMPPALHDHVRDLPVPVDIRSLIAPDGSVDTTDPAWTAAIVDIGARLHDRTVEAMVAEVERRRRQQVGSITAAAIVLALVTVAATFGAVAAWRSRDEANRREREVVAQNLVLESQRLSATRPNVASAIAARAWVHDHSPMTLGAVVSAAAYGTEYEDLRWGGDLDVSTVFLADDGATVLIGGRDGSVVAWRPPRQGRDVAGDDRHWPSPHRVPVVAIVGAHHGSRIRSVDASGMVVTWDVDSGRLIDTLDLDVDVTAAAGDDAGRLLAVGTRTGELVVVDLTTGSVITRGRDWAGPRAGGRVSGIDVDEHLRIASISSGGTVAVLDGSTGTHLAGAVAQLPPTSVAWSADGHAIALTTNDGRTRIFDDTLTTTISDGTEGLHSAPGTSVRALGASGFASIGGDRDLVTFAIDNGNVDVSNRSVSHPGIPVALDTVPAEGLAATAGRDGSVTLIRPGVVAPIGEHLEGIATRRKRADRMEPDPVIPQRAAGNVARTYRGATSFAVTDLVRATRTPVQTPGPGPEEIAAIAADPHASRMAIADASGDVTIVAGQGVAAPLHLRKVASTAIDMLGFAGRDARWLWSVTDTGAVLATPVRNGRARSLTIREAEEQPFVRSVTASTAAPKLAVAVGDRVELWSIGDSPRRLASRRPPVDPARLFSLGTDRFLVGDDHGNTVVLSGRDLHLDSPILATGDLAITDATAFGTRGDSVLVVSGTSRLEIWSTATGRRLATLPDVTSSLVAAATTSDGAAVLSGDGEIWRLRFDADRIVAGLCRRLGSGHAGAAGELRCPARSAP